MSEQVVKYALHTEATKQAFLADYFETGIIKESSNRTGVPYETAKHWHRSSWFQEDLARMQDAANKAADKRISKLIEKSLAQIDDRIEFGEERLTKDGEIIRVKAGLAALTIATGTLFDKRQILRKGAEAESTTDDILERLADKLRSIKTPIIIDAEIVEINDPT